MKYLIFAGGHGTRFWPLSRKNSPKQFEKMFEGFSTLQLAYKRIQPIAKKEDIIISTNEKFKELIKNQIPDILEKNLVLEPAKKDLAAAIGYNILKLKQAGYKGPIAILWSDHLMKYPEKFQKALHTAEKLIIQNPKRFVYIAETPTFANHNLGWIKIGDKLQEKNGFGIYQFTGWKYRPDIELCQSLYKSKKALWNTGYFVTSIEFLDSLYQKFQPKLYNKLQEIISHPEEAKNLYEQLQELHFDTAIVEKVDTSQAVVIKADLGWTDPGTLYALKNALSQNTSKNVTIGKSFLLDVKDSLVINKEDKKLITAINLEGFIIVNTKDVLLVLHKDDAHKVKELVKKLEENNLKEYI